MTYLKRLKSRAPTKSGFGLEMLADVTHSGTWHIGVLAAPGIPEMLLAGREREFLAGYAYLR